MLYIRGLITTKLNNMKIVNCTPHPITLIREDGGMINLPKGEVVPRVAQVTQIVASVLGVAVTKSIFGEVENLPPFKEEVFLIVSRVVMSACSGRTDLLVPADLVRDEQGNIIGCKSLSRD